MPSIFDLECPKCSVRLHSTGGWHYRCPACGATYEVCGRYLQPTGHQHQRHPVGAERGHHAGVS